MGEMIKFGIKLALCIATALALTAALLILYDLIASFTFSTSSNGGSFLYEIFRVISLVFPVNLRTLFTTIASLFAFKVAYWAADKMIQFISATS